MEREPKVACVELNCALRHSSKNNMVCELCKNRVKYLAMIGMTTLGEVAALQTWGQEHTLHRRKEGHGQT